MKKETIILIVAIVALGLYLGLRNNNRTHYTLPELNKVPIEKISRIVIKRKGETLTLKHHDSRWLIEPQGFKADEKRVKKMAEALSGLKLTALASESGETARYKLGDNDAIRVSLYDGKKLLRDIRIGKTASTYHHTYVQFPGKKEIYLARGNFRREFDVKVDQIRDKIVLKLDRDSVNGIELQQKNTPSLSLMKESIPVNITPGKKSKEPAGATPRKPKWKTPDGRVALEGQVDQILTACTLNCDSFLPKEAVKKLKAPICTLTLKGAETATLKIYPQNKDGKYPAMSSQCDFPFLLSTWKVDRVKQAPDKILEKSAPAKKKKGKRKKK